MFSDRLKVEFEVEALFDRLEVEFVHEVLFDRFEVEVVFNGFHMTILEEV